MQYRIIHSRMTRLREKVGPADAMSKAASEGIVESAKALLDTLDKWSLKQSTVPQIKRIQVSHLVCIQCEADIPERRYSLSAHDCNIPPHRDLIHR